MPGQVYGPVTTYVNFERTLPFSLSPSLVDSNTQNKESRHFVPLLTVCDSNGGDGQPFGPIGTADGLYQGLLITSTSDLDDRMEAPKRLLCVSRDLVSK